jgi:hypothetical protein
MLRNFLSLFTSAAQRSTASAALLSIWLAWSPSVRQRSNDAELAANPRLFRDSDSTSSRASLVRSTRPGGAQSLSGRTQFQLRGAIRTVVADETAEIDAEGRLVRAELNLRYVGQGSQRLPTGLIAQAIFDASAGLVSALDQEGVTRTRRVEANAPWVYLPVSLPSGVTLSTPVAVVVARAAARAAPDVLRVSALDSALSVSSDQLWVSGTNEDWVLLGDDLATFSGDSAEGDQLVKLHVAALAQDLRPHATARASL